MGKERIGGDTVCRLTGERDWERLRAFVLHALFDQAAEFDVRRSRRDVMLCPFNPFSPYVEPQISTLREDLRQKSRDATAAAAEVHQQEPRGAHVLPSLRQCIEDVSSYHRTDAADLFNQIAIFLARDMGDHCSWRNRHEGVAGGECEVFHVKVKITVPVYVDDWHEGSRCVGLLRRC